MKGRNKQTNNRRDKVNRGESKVVKEKFMEERMDNLPPLKPMNELQKEYIHNIRTKDVNFAIGFAGSSKSYIPTVIASDMLRMNEIKKIYLVRPFVSDSKSAGFFAGDMITKSKLWLAPILDTLYERLGRNNVDYYLEKGAIEPVPLELIKGRSFKDAFVIVDEAEDLTEKEFIKCITRIGTNCRCVFAGDVRQVDIKSNSGIQLGYDMAKENPEFDWGFVNFDQPSDIVRGKVAKDAILGLHRMGKI